MVDDRMKNQPSEEEEPPTGDLRRYFLFEGSCEGLLKDVLAPALSESIFSNAK